MDVPDGSARWDTCVVVSRLSHVERADRGFDDRDGAVVMLADGVCQSDRSGPSDPPGPAGARVDIDLPPGPHGS